MFYTLITMMINKLSIIAFILFSQSIPTVSAAGGTHNTVVSESTRLEAAKKELSENVIALYVKGLICESCGLGIKVKSKKLPFIDKKQFSKGVKVDAENQLVYLAIKKNERADKEAIKTAITKAGYVPVTFFELKNGKVQLQQAK